VLFFISVDSAQKLELFDTAEAMLDGDALRAVTFVAAFLRFGELWLLFAPFYWGGHMNIWVLFVHT
jgi:hypothetical protein